MVDWEPTLKKYPHFDGPISEPSIQKFVRDPERVAANKFYPFMLFTEGWQPFRTKPGGKPDKKTRELRFAARRDAYIFAYYRHLLIQPYETLLAAEGLSDHVIAYRKIPKPGGGGKCNIDFAKDAFDRIVALGQCAAVALDISSFFEKLDHQLLREKWERVLGVKPLPKDHDAVFRAITRYSVVERDAVYERLGFLLPNPSAPPTYTVSRAAMPKKLCDNKTYRTQVCGENGGPKSLVRTNRKPYGIPQGSPISDLLANIYLLDFDRTLADYCVSRGGMYYRYSDDVLILLPGDAADALAARDFATAEIGKHGSKLLIKDKKTAALTFAPAAGGDGQDFTHVAGAQGHSGLEYLGFRFDGRRVHLRDTTVAKLYRKISAAVMAAAAAHITRYPGKDLGFLQAHFDYSAFLQKFGRVEDFEPTDGVESWTFHTYVARASKAFGPVGNPIARQLRNVKAVVRRRMVKEIARRFSKKP